MDRSRRSLVTAVGSAGLATLTGCIGTGLSGGRGDEDDPDDGTTGGEPTTSDTDDSGGEMGTGTDGSARFVARLAGPDGSRPFFDGGDVSAVGPVEERNGGYRITITLTESGTAAVRENARDAGLAESPGTFEIVIHLDGEVVNRFDVSPGFAREVVRDDWQGRMLLAFSERAPAREVRSALAGDS